MIESLEGTMEPTWGRIGGRLVIGMILRLLRIRVGDCDDEETPKTILSSAKFPYRCVPSGRNETRSENGSKQSAFQSTLCTNCQHKTREPTNSNLMQLHKVEPSPCNRDPKPSWLVGAGTTHRTASKGCWVAPQRLPPNITPTRNIALSWLSLERKPRGPTNSGTTQNP